MTGISLFAGSRINIGDIKIMAEAMPHGIIHNNFNEFVVENI
jgi:hypothetical protein